MTEWLLSGQNTQESMQVSRPMTITTAESGLNNEIRWFTEALAGDTSGFDQRMSPAQVVQDWVYLNISYFVRNVGMVMPFDPTSLGAPADLITEKRKVPLGQMVRLPGRFRRVYAWATTFYRERLPDLADELRTYYWMLREKPDDVIQRLWPFFERHYYDSYMEAGRAHIVISMIVTGVDSTLRERVPQLIGLFAGNATTTSLMGQRIWELRLVAEQCGSEVCDRLRAGEAALATYATLPAAAPLVDGVRAFLREYGHRGFSRELDYEAERLADHPEHVLLAIASQLDEDEPPARRAAAARQEAERALHRMNPVSRLIWSRVLQWGQQLISWREESKSCVVAKQAIFGLAARYFSEYFYHDAPNDMMLFYTLDEFLAFARNKGKERVPRDILERRRAEFELHKTQSPPPELIWYDPDTQHWRPALEAADEPASAAGEQPATRFEGIAACAGSGPVEGIALVTNDPIAAARRLLELDEPVILVTRLTDPAWSSLFAGLAGVVTELGGLISHATIVARENGLPAVVGVTDATQNLRSGQRLRLDGERGTVEIL